MYEFLKIFPLVNVIYFLVIIIFVWMIFNKSLDFIDTKIVSRILKYAEKKENRALIEKFDHIHAVLAYHMEAAYETIHKDNILVYSLDGVKPTEEDITRISKDYVKLVMELAGPNMLDFFVQLYGDEDTLFFVMIDYFTRRFEDDEVRNSSIDEIQQGEG